MLFRIARILAADPEGEVVGFAVKLNRRRDKPVVRGQRRAGVIVVGGAYHNAVA